MEATSGKVGGAAEGQAEAAAQRREAALSEGTKAPRTDRGRRTLRALLDAAAAEFGEKGFHESSVVSITSRAGVALGSFYTYFDSKETSHVQCTNETFAQIGCRIDGNTQTKSRSKVLFVHADQFRREYSVLYYFFTNHLIWF